MAGEACVSPATSAVSHEAARSRIVAPGLVWIDERATKACRATRAPSARPDGRRLRRAPSGSADGGGWGRPARPARSAGTSRRCTRDWTSLSGADEVAERVAPDAERPADVGDRGAARSWPCPRVHRRTRPTMVRPAPVTDASLAWISHALACWTRRNSPGKRKPAVSSEFRGGRCRSRTSDLLLVRQALSQLS
jgi:hypothetical protein